MLDRLTLDQLRMLAAVADTGSFSGAGRKLRRAQSAISQAIQALEKTLDVALFDRAAKTPALTEAGRVILADARELLRDAESLRGRAASIAGGVEPELLLAVEVMFPLPLLMKSLKALAAEFPHVAVSLFTESLGGGNQRLRDGTARLGLFAPLVNDSEFVSTYLTGVPMVPVVAAGHPLARMKGPLDNAALERHMQLVLTDRTALTVGFSGGVISRRTWRFADIGTRLEFLLAGFGWCNMPLHMVETYIARKRLKRLQLVERGSWTFPIHVIHRRDRPPGRAGQWLIADLKARLSATS